MSSYPNHKPSGQVTQLLRTVLSVLAMVTGLVVTSPLAAFATEQTVAFDSVGVAANPNNWTITGLENTINGNTAGGNFARIFTGQQDATGVVIDYEFDQPIFQALRLQLWNNGGGILTDFDGIGSATVEVFDPEGSVLWTGTLNAGNGGAIFTTDFPGPLDNVSRVRLSDITNLGTFVAQDIIWRQLNIVQEVATPEISTEINADGFSDDVTITGTEGFDGTLSWILFGPVPVGPSGTCDDADWTGAPVFDSGTVDVTDDGVVTTTPATPPSDAGCYSYEDVLSSNFYTDDAVSEVGQPAETFEIEPDPAIALDKSASPADAESFQDGQEITYSFVATNTGNTTLNNVTVEETDFTGAGTLGDITCPGANGNITLAPDESVNCTATYTLTQADIDAGEVTNAAEAIGEPLSGDPVTSADAEVLSGDPNPDMTLVKTAAPETVSEAGEVITYTFVSTNTGNTTLMNITVEETDFTGTGELGEIICPGGNGSITLAPGDSVTCTAEYTVTQADIDADGVTNTARGSADGVDGPLASPPSQASIAVLGDTVSPPSESTSTTAESSASTLPFTGSVASDMLPFAMLSVLAGGIMIVAAWRRWPAQRDERR